MGIFKKKKTDKNKNKKLSSDIIRTKVYRLVNNSPIQIVEADAKLIRDENNNTIIFDGENNIKEELPGLYDSLISDILYKLESKGLSLEGQILKVKLAIEKQENIINKTKDGFIEKEIVKDGKKEIEKIKVNSHTEKKKLGLLKCVLYTLDNKKGQGFFESVELDGTRCLSYLIRDGDLIPYWYRTPTEKGEPVILVPDVVQRKKFWKESTDEAINDFNESQDHFWKGVLGVLTKVTFVVLFIALVVWTIHNARWSGELYDEDLTPKLQAYELEIQKVRHECSEQLANQIENNEILLDYAKQKIQEEQTTPDNNIEDKSNIKI